MDKGLIDYNLKEIRKKKGTPFHLANEKIADETFTKVKGAYPDAVMVKNGMNQYIVITKRAKTILLKQLRDMKDKCEATISDIEIAIQSLN